MIPRRHRNRLLTAALPLALAAALTACAPPGSPGRHGAQGAPAPVPSLVQPGTNHAASADAYAYPAAKVHDWLVEGPKAPDYPTQKIAFLTFDDGPSKDATPAVLDALNAGHVPGTFFVIAGPTGLEKAGPAFVQQEVADGNAVCIHSFSHDYEYLYPHRKADVQHILADEQKAAAGLRAALGPQYTPTCFRYPGGHMSWQDMAPADEMLAGQGLSWIDWNTMTGDAEGRRAPATPAAAASAVEKDIRMAGKPNVVVVLMHDGTGKKISTEALPQIISELRAGGYSFGVIS